MIEGIRQIAARLEQHRYIADRGLATTLFLAVEMTKPLLVEGPAGVGKTEIAKVLASALQTRLIRLQCYEGLDATTTLYEWNYPKQMLRATLEASSQRSEADKEQLIFSEAYLLKRPLLEALVEPERSPVLLIDEVDRADEEFEAFLLEVLSDFQVTIPEMGSIQARHCPHVVLTSNRTRELSDALKRRCAYLWIPYPDPEKELRIVNVRLPGLRGRLSQQIVGFMQVVRRLPLVKVPGTAETLDWAVSLMKLHAECLDPELVRDTAGFILKEQEDVAQLSSTRVERVLTELADMDRTGTPLSEDTLEAMAARIMEGAVP